jgi:hypothetical protein
MVKIVNYKERLREDNSSFYVLEVQGGIELVKSQSTGNYYATSKKAYIPTTFNEILCQSLIGQELEGSIVRQECKPYSYVVKDTGEELTLRHRWVFTPEKEQAVIQKQETNDALFMPVNAFNISDQQAYPS